VTIGDLVVTADGFVAALHSPAVGNPHVSHSCTRVVVVSPALPDSPATGRRISWTGGRGILYRQILVCVIIHDLASSRPRSYARHRAAHRTASPRSYGGAGLVVRCMLMRLFAIVSTAPQGMPAL